MKEILENAATEIELLREPREGGYIFVTSPELPGFSFLLEPGEDDDLKTIPAALLGPLVAYLEAERAANVLVRPL